MELNIWTSSTVTNVSKDKDKKWIVTVQRADGTERVFHVDHVVFALGLGAGKPNMPQYPGRVSVYPTPKLRCISYIII
jgi:cation diffusion facilitator CzcD-associated flavoprotein CzcO